MCILIIGHLKLLSFLFLWNEENVCSPNCTLVTSRLSKSVSIVSGIMCVQNYLRSEYFMCVSFLVLRQLSTSSLCCPLQEHKKGKMSFHFLLGTFARSVPILLLPFVTFITSVALIIWYVAYNVYYLCTICNATAYSNSFNCVMR